MLDKKKEEMNSKKLSIVLLNDKILDMKINIKLLSWKAELKIKGKGNEFAHIIVWLDLDKSLGIIEKWFLTKKREEIFEGNINRDIISDYLEKSIWIWKNIKRRW